MTKLEYILGAICIIETILILTCVTCLLLFKDRILRYFAADFIIKVKSEVGEQVKGGLDEVKSIVGKQVKNKVESFLGENKLDEVKNFWGMIKKHNKGE